MHTHVRTRRNGIPNCRVIPNIEEEIHTAEAAEEVNDMDDSVGGAGAQQAKDDVDEQHDGGGQNPHAQTRTLHDQKMQKSIKNRQMRKMT